jgi:CHAD domain-containing protein
MAKQFADKRAEALERARKAVDSPRCRALLIDVLAWIEAQRGRTDVANSKLGGFAAKLLDRRMRKAQKDAGKLQEMTAPERHKFRIRMKKIRYAAEFFESLFRSKRERKALARLSKHAKKIQDALGSLNDFIADRKMAAEAALHAPPQNRRARAFVSGIIVGREDEQARPLMKAATRELRALRHLSGPG